MTNRLRGISAPIYKYLHCRGDFTKFYNRLSLFVLNSLLCFISGIEPYFFFITYIGTSLNFSLNAAVPCAAPQGDQHNLVFLKKKKNKKEYNQSLKRHNVGA